jgi:hypothetical protein
MKKDIWNGLISLGTLGILAYLIKKDNDQKVHIRTNPHSGDIEELSDEEIKSENLINLSPAEINALKGNWVEVYYNLHKDTFSIRLKGKVVAHADYVQLSDVKFGVGQGGRYNVRKSGQKNVHAFVRGILTDFVPYRGVPLEDPNRQIPKAQTTSLAYYSPRDNEHDRFYVKTKDSRFPKMKFKTFNGQTETVLDPSTGHQEKKNPNQPFGKDLIEEHTAGVDMRNEHIWDAKKGKNILRGQVYLRATKPKTISTQLSLFDDI